MITLEIGKNRSNSRSDPLKLNGYHIYHLIEHSETLHFVHRVHLVCSVDSRNSE